MSQIVAIGFAAGAASALLFASVASGSLFSVFLFYLAPLPIMIAAIGWSHYAGLLAAISAAAWLGLFLGGFFFIAFLVGIGLPAWWLGYLALMARPDEESGKLEWYPVGRLVLWASIIAALIVIVTIPTFGTDLGSFQASLSRTFERILRVQTRVPDGKPLEVPGLSDPARLIDFLVLAIPPMAAVLTTLTSLINLWLAGRIARMSGRLPRPWPHLAAMTFPRFAPVLLAAAVAGSFAPDLAGVMAGALAAALVMAYAVLGFAVLHMITASAGGRSFILAGIYAAVAVFGWPILFVTLLGLIDGVMDLRARVARRRGSPSGRIE
jgi:hypothetical protein